MKTTPNHVDLGKPSKKKVRPYSSFFVAQNFSRGGEGVPPKMRTFVGGFFSPGGGVPPKMRTFVGNFFSLGGGYPQK